MAFLLTGIYVRLGGFKPLYLVEGIPVLMPQALRNIPLPFGIILITLTVSGSNLVPNFETRGLIFDWIVTPMFIVSIVLAVWNPRWLQP